MHMGAKIHAFDSRSGMRIGPPKSSDLGRGLIDEIRQPLESTALKELCARLTGRPTNDLTVAAPAISPLDTPSRERTRSSEQLALRSIAPEPYFPALLPQVPGQGEVWESNR